jgi:hypothetical protein
MGAGRNAAANMDVISLKPYRQPPSSNGKPDFIEFFINDQPLSGLLNSFFKLKDGILENWVGVLGHATNPCIDIIKLKQLLNKNVTDKDLRAAFPASWSENELSWYLDKYREELAKPEVLIYCCAACGDIDCGGWWVTITRDEETVSWSIGSEEEASISFTFDKYQYFDVLGARIEYLQKKIRSPK